VVDGHPNLPVSALPPSVIAAEKRARALLAEGKWRAARDEVKSLAKLDRSRFLPILVAANTGLFREFVQKGRAADARQVLSFLATVIPADQVRALEAEMTAAAHPAPGASLDSLAASQGSLPPAELVRLADRVVIAFEPVPVGNPPLAGLAAELAVIHDGLAQVSAARWDGLADRLRAVPRRSPFSHWAVFIKGLAAFYTGDNDRAIQCFENLPAGSVPAKAGQGYLVLAGRLEPDPLSPPGAASLGVAGRVLGRPSAGQQLCRAEQLWRADRHVDSYRVWRDGVSLFPSDGPDWLGALSEFYFQATRSLNEEQSDDYLCHFMDLLRRAGKNDVEDLLGHRMLGLQAVREGAWSIAAEEWDKFLTIRAKVRKPNPKLEAVAYCWLGQQMVVPRPGQNPVRLGGLPAMQAPARGRSYFQKAVALDPNLLPASLWLCHVYASLGQNRERNQLLDEMTRRFPDEKPVLLLAADRCIGSKAFTKAIALVERARELDRLDPTIPAMMVLCWRQHAWQQFQQQQPDKARTTLAATAEFLTDKPDDFHLGRWTNTARHGLQEELHGDPAAGRSLLAQARSASPFPGAFLLFAQIAYRYYAKRRSKESPFLGELRTELKTGASAVRAAQLLRQMQFWSDSADAPEVSSEYQLVRGYVAAAAKLPCAREEARIVVELCLSSGSEGQARLFTKAALRRDRDDPLFGFFDHSLRTAWEASSPRHRAELEKLLGLAQDRRDQEAIQKIQHALRALNAPPPTPAYSEPEQDQDEDWDDGPEIPSGVLPPMPPGMEAGIGQLMEALRDASPEEVEDLRRTAPKDVPPFILNMFIQAARAAPPRPNRRRPPGPPSGQQEFF